MNAESRQPEALMTQCARSVLMVRPASFYANPETLATNAFQHVVAVPATDTLAAAQAEFDRAAEALGAAGVAVVVADAIAAADTPDALYPNNWFSTHADGRVVLYPMAVPSRRRERRPELLAALAKRHHWRITATVDLTGLEDAAQFVEGTGSLVLDRSARLAYAALSPRTHPAAVERVCRELGYEPVVFAAHDAEGREVYHTNVLMSVGPGLAVLASSMIAPGAGLRRVFDALERSGQALLDISAEQVAEFAGNLLFLDGGREGPLVALSRRAYASLTRPQRALLERHARPVPCAVETIEHVGGGGIRCMLAENFLPPSPCAPPGRADHRPGRAARPAPRASGRGGQGATALRCRPRSRAAPGHGRLCTYGPVWTLDRAAQGMGARATPGAAVAGADTGRLHARRSRGFAGAGVLRARRAGRAGPRGTPRARCGRVRPRSAHGRGRVPVCAECGAVAADHSGRGRRAPAGHAAGRGGPRGPGSSRRSVPPRRRTRSTDALLNPDRT
jgi:hypothetical protein